MSNVGRISDVPATESKGIGHDVRLRWPAAVRVAADEALGDELVRLVVHRRVLRESPDAGHDDRALGDEVAVEDVVFLVDMRKAYMKGALRTLSD